MVKAGIVGGAGFTGGELIRVLVRHPDVVLSFVQSGSQAGKPLGQVHEDLAEETDLTFSAGVSQDIDVLFLCVGHGEARKFLEGQALDSHIRIIDLSEDHRVRVNGSLPKFQEREFVYGLPELNRERIRMAPHVANPGCFASAVQLGLLPLAKAGLLAEVSSTGITGSTGAGQGLSATGHFSWRANNIQAYKSLQHQHRHEIVQSLEQLQSGFGKDREMVHFVPWRGDFTRGIFVSSQLNCNLTMAQLEELYSEYYRNHPFTRLSRSPIFLKQVVNTNHCLVQLEQVGDRLVVHTALDNLLKGASGQAVQNMNLMFGLQECAALQLKASYF